MMVGTENTPQLGQFSEPEMDWVECYRLLRQYDKVAFNFLALDAITGVPPFFQEDKLNEMRKNFSTDSGGLEPGTCDVLSTYLSIHDAALADTLEGVANEIVTDAFLTDVDHYTMRKGTYHISLVMLHDVRPTDKQTPAITDAVLTPDQVDNVKSRLAQLQHQKFTLRLHGIRFGLDGSVFAVFTDDGGTLSVRRTIHRLVKSELKPEALKYPKPFIHVTLLRILEQITPATLVRLQAKQREFFCLAQRDLTMPVNRFHLGHETRWCHKRVNEVVTIEFFEKD